MSHRDETIAANIGLVHACCRRFTGRGAEYDDLFQAGCVGLIKAVDNFDADRGLMLSTYAVPVILGEIRRIFREGGTVKVSRPLKELALKATRVSETLAKELGRAPLVSELAERLGVAAEEAAQALCAAQPALSLTVDEDGEITERDLPCEDMQDKLCDTLALKGAIEGLCERDRRLIRLRYFDERTQTQTAALLGMTQVQVSRREKTIIGKLREQLECGQGVKIL